MKAARNIIFTYINTPYAATPSSPAYFISWILYSMPTTDMEILDISSEEPLAQAFSNARPSNFVLVSRSSLVWGRPK